MARELQHRTNNAYDTILLVDDGKVIGDWTVGNDGHDLRNFANPGDLAGWETTTVFSEDPQEYGDLFIDADED